MTLNDFQVQIAKENRLGDKLVTGHKKQYFDQAAILFAEQEVRNALEAASLKAEINREYLTGCCGDSIATYSVDKNSIINSYKIS